MPKTPFERPHEAAKILATPKDSPKKPKKLPQKVSSDAA